MSHFLLDVALPFGLVVSLMALAHVLFARRGTAWFLIVVLLGPFGGLFYLAAQLKWIKFEPGKRPDSTEATATRRCPSCQRPAGSLYEVDDGRTKLHLCAMCKSELEFRRSGFTLPEL